MEEGCLELSLDIAELMAYGGLGQPESRTGGCNATFFDDGLDQSEVAQFEVHEEEEVIPCTNIIKQYLLCSNCI